MDNYEELAKYEMIKSKDALKEAEILYNAESYSGAANRSYYAAFHAMSALLASDEHKYSNHGGVIARFREFYIKTGIIDKSISNKIGDLFMMRTLSDYDVFYVVAKADVKEQIDNAKDLISAIESVLKRKLTRESNYQQEQPLRKDLIEQQKQCGGYTPPATPVKQEQPAPELTQKLTPPKKSGQGFGGLKR